MTERVHGHLSLFPRAGAGTLFSTGERHRHHICVGAVNPRGSIRADDRQARFSPGAETADHVGGVMQAKPLNRGGRE
jgi:hypothetical protein